MLSEQITILYALVKNTVWKSSSFSNHNIFVSKTVADMTLNRIIVSWRIQKKEVRVLKGMRLIKPKFGDSSVINCCLVLSYLLPPFWILMQVVFWWSKRDKIWWHLICFEDNKYWNFLFFFQLYAVNLQVSWVQCCCTDLLFFNYYFEH